MINASLTTDSKESAEGDLNSLFADNASRPVTPMEQILLLDTASASEELKPTKLIPILLSRLELINQNILSTVMSQKMMPTLPEWVFRLMLFSIKRFIRAMILLWVKST